MTPSCEICAMWRAGQNGKGLCHLVPPTPIYVGMQQRPPALAGMPAAQPQVVMIHARAETLPGDFCGQWRPTPEALAAIEPLADLPANGLYEGLAQPIRDEAGTATGLYHGLKRQPTE